MTLTTDAVHVREFTAGAGQPTPDYPEEMSVSEVSFLGKMMLDEIMELFATVLPPAEAKEAMKTFIDDSKDIALIQEGGQAHNKALIISEQADALVDVYYYSLNAAAKKGVNISSIFSIVHAANMAKRDPATGEFLKRADGKIIKPAGWKAPDVKAEIERQLSEGAWKGCVAGTDAVHVREFTAGAGQPTPDRPCVMTTAEVAFLVKMMLDEIMELFATVLPPAEAKAAMKGFIDESKDIPLIANEDGDDALIISEQADALVDVYYYSLNAAAKKGVNISSIFSIVHAANMAKRDPATGEFIKRADGKIIKPAGWKAPDVKAEIERQMERSAWAVEGGGQEGEGAGALVGKAPLAAHVQDENSLSASNTPVKA